MTQTCRAVVFLGNERFDVRELPVPGPPPGGAVVQVEAVGLCGSDLAEFAGVELIPGGSTFPVVPGHEVVGRVVALARDADLGIAEGDRVAVDEVLSLAPMRVYGYSDMTGNGEVGLWGGYGEYMEIFAGTRLHRMSDRLPADELTLFEPLANAMNWVGVVGVDAGDTVVVQGPGHQGLAVLEAVLARKPSSVVVTGTSQDGLRLDAAKAIGATEVVMVDVDDPRTVVADLTAGEGADVVFDVATATETVPLALDLVRQRGRILLAGLKHFREIPGPRHRPHRRRRVAGLRRRGLHPGVDGRSGGADRGGRGPHRHRPRRGVRPRRHRGRDGAPRARRSRPRCRTRRAPAYARALKARSSTKMVGRLQDRVAIITGAGDGIGRGMARRFAAEGAKVLVAELSEESGPEVVHELAQEFGADARFVHTDVGRRADNVAMVAAAVDTWGKVDILVNNAWGGGSLGRVEFKTDDAMDHALRVGFLGPFWAMQATFPIMKAQGYGRIVNICSLNGVNAHMGTADYNTAKEALRTLTRSAAREWAPTGVVANVICPGALTAASRACSRRTRS